MTVNELIKALQALPAADRKRQAICSGYEGGYLVIRPEFSRLAIHPETRAWCGTHEETQEWHQVDEDGISDMCREENAAIRASSFDALKIGR